MSKTKFFEAFTTHDAGVWCFTPDEEKNYQEGKPCSGFGMTSYLEGSFYSGELYFDGRNYHKQGFGQQWFTYSDIGRYSEYYQAKIYLFEGNFDYRKTNWTYGNGILYYVNEKNEPKYYVKGFFLGLMKRGEWQGEFDESKLHHGFTKEMEIQEPLFMGFDVGLKEMEAQDQLESLDNLFIGDSYMEFWHSSFWAGNNRFEDVFDTKHCLNLGIGSTTCFDYPIFYQEKFSLLKETPKRIFVNLGFNDCNSLIVCPVEKLLSRMESFIDRLHQDYPKARIYWYTVCKSTASEGRWDRIEAYNEFLRENQNRLHYEVIDVAESYFDHHVKDEDYATNFHEDGIHPNEKGYQIYVDLTKEIITKER